MICSNPILAQNIPNSAQVLSYTYCSILSWLRSWDQLKESVYYTHDTYQLRFSFKINKKKTFTICLVAKTIFSILSCCYDRVSKPNSWSFIRCTLPIFKGIQQAYNRQKLCHFYINDLPFAFRGICLLREWHLYLLKVIFFKIYRILPLRGKSVLDLEGIFL